MNRFTQFVLNSDQRLAMPISTYPGLALTGGSVADMVTNPVAQYDAQAALYDRYRTWYALSAMDLSTEAEAFGCELHLSDSEIPSVTGRLVTNIEQARNLQIPRPGDKRTKVGLETVRLLKRLPGTRLVLGGCIGPFSLAARLVGVSEALELTLSEPELMDVAVEKSAAFLTDYVRSFQAAGADGVIVAEPAAGLLSPRGMSRYSSMWIRQIAASFDVGEFAIILHNCAAKPAHLSAILETGLSAFHFGSPMDLGLALTRMGPEAVVCGNLDPTAVFSQVSAEAVAKETRAVMAATAGARNHVVSSGCDLPPGTPLANLDAFFAAVKGV